MKQSLALLLAATAVVSAQEAVPVGQDLIPAGEEQPFLRLEPGGPQSYVTALAFDATGSTLYAAGWDKVVHVWRRDPQGGVFQLHPESTLRLPIGPGLLGAINAMALSEDGQWLAVAGHGVFRGTASFRQPGRVVPSQGIVTDDMRRDEGLIYVFNMQDNSVRLLRGHVGSVLALTFATGQGATPVLVSGAREWREAPGTAAGYIGMLRAWDVGRVNNSLIAVHELAEPRTRPALAANRTGPAPAAIQVAISWGDERFRMWDVAANQLQEIACGKSANTVSSATRHAEFVTASMERLATGDAALLQLRRSTAVVQQLPLGPPTRRSFLYPMALSTPSGAEPSRLVGIVSLWLDRDAPAGTPNKFLLQRFRVEQGQLAKLPGDSVLWNVPPTGALPAIATAAQGDLIAVAGNSDHSIWLFQANDNKQGKEPFQVLRNAGSRWQQIQFVANEEKTGLRLRLAKEELVFDLTNRTVQRQAQGWQDASAAPGTWRVEPPRDATTSALILRRDDQEASRITLPRGETFSTSAILPSDDAGDAANRRPAIVAVASHQLGQVSLRLYNAETGELFRQLTGHSQTISGLSFHAGGRWLATVAGDQLICLWDLSDWKSIVHQQGAFPGVAVTKRTAAEQTLVAVAAVNDTAPAAIRRVLSPGDVLERVTVGDDQRSWGSVREFYDAIWLLKPGTQVTARVVRSGEAREVPLLIGQGVDERKPLLSLFLTAAEKGAPEWIAWSPLGPYETSGRAAERFLGWHFNTGKANRPTQFAAAEEYRATYYRDGLVKELLELGRIPQRQAPVPAAMTLRFDPETQQQQAAGETIVIRRVPNQVHVFLGDFPAEYVDRIEVAIEGATVGEFSPLPENEWVADLGDRRWQRGVTRVRATVLTNEVPPRQFTREVPVDYVPLPPVVRTAAAPRQVVKQPVFPFAARLESPSGEPLVVRLLHNGKSSDPMTLAPGQTNVERELMLQPGDNTIELVAVNQAAAAANSTDETARSVMHVTYHKAKALPPRLAVQQLETLDAKTGGWVSLWSKKSTGSVMVASEKLKLTGTITATEPPSRAQWTKTSAAEREGTRQPLSWEKTAAPNVWQFTQIVDVLPGKQQLGFFAQSADSDEAALALAVDFRPPLPEIEWQADEEPSVVQREASDAHVELLLSGKLVLPRPAHPFEAQIMINDEPAGRPIVDLDRGTFTSKVTLRRGENRIRLELTNRWDAATTSATRIVQLQVLPRVLTASHSPVGKVPLIEVTATIETATDRPLTQVTVAGKSLDRRDWQQTSEKDGVAIWKVIAKEVALEPGQNEIRVTAANNDGPGRKAGTLKVAYEAQNWRPPTIVITNAGPSESVTQPLFGLTLQVSSASPLRSFQVAVNGAEIPKDKVKLAGPQGAAPRLRWDVTTDVPLKPGVNRVTVTARNEGGEARDERALNYVPPPVRIQLLAVESEDDTQNSMRPTMTDQGWLACPRPSSTGNVRLRGVVEWNRPVTSPTGANPELRVWVNGFQQQPVSLDRKQARQEFVTPIVLGGVKENFVTLDIAGAPTDANNRVMLALECLQPETTQRLNLLVIGANQTNAEAIKRRALESIRVEKDANGNFQEPLRAPGFQRVQVYRPLTSNITFSDVFRLLLQVKADLKIPLGPDASGRVLPVNDVVMLYYEGGILVPEKDHFVLRTSERYDAGNRFSVISSEWLAQFFDSMRGAQLAFIDVSTEKPPAEIPVADWSHSTHAALLCYAWKRGFVPSDDERIIRAVDKALGTAHRLGELDDQLARLSATQPEVDYSRVLPERLRSLVLASPD